MRSLLQLTLDLFDAAPAPVAPTPTAAPRVSPREPDVPVSRTPDASKKIAKSTPLAEPLERVLVPAAFVHPQASRQLLLAGAHVAYAFRRSRRRTIGFSVGPDGLAVSAPNWVPLHEVDAALHEKAAWILRKLDEARERQQRLASARIEWRDGATFPFLGEPVQVRLDPRHGFGAPGAQFDAALRALQVALPQAAAAQQIRDVVQAWLMRQSRRIFTERLHHYAPQLGVQWKKLALSSAGTRWGSASADGTIRLNWRLVHLRLPIIDYVVAHELSHLRVMDHSPRFWDTVESVMPDYAARRRELKAEPVPDWA